VGKLDQRVAIVTGAASGIGRAIAEAFATEGAAVAIADIDEAGAREVADGIAAAGGKALAVAVDVTDEGSVARMANAVASELGAVGVLVNNAGIDTVAPLVEMPLEMWQQMMDVNLRACSSSRRRCCRR
jgi:NAD(P)-dependent dehydrogenase (short-subunit alcohol dehydrogenase family)